MTLSISAEIERRKARVAQRTSNIVAGLSIIISFVALAVAIYLGILSSNSNAIWQDKELAALARIENRLPLVLKGRR